MPSVNEEGDPHHAQGASLWDPAESGMGFPKTRGERVVDEQGHLKPGVSVNKEIGEANGSGDTVEKLSAYLVETFPNIGCRPAVWC